MHYRDLSSPSNKGVILKNVLNVGWLEKNSQWDRDDKWKNKDEFLKKLRDIFYGNESFNSNVKLIRGPAHKCNICGVVVEEPNPRGGFISLGSCEIWIKSGRKYYAAPSLIIHYVESHGYKPPREYIKSVMNIDINSDYDAKLDRKKVLIESKNKSSIVKNLFSRKS